MPEDQQQKRKPLFPKPQPGGGDGPRVPDVERPDTTDLLKRLRRVDPDQARKYRQRGGQ